MNWLRRAVSNVEMKQSDVDGVGLFAQNDFQPGDLVFLELPLVNTKSNLTCVSVCDHCLKPLVEGSPSFRCPRQCSDLYCSEICMNESEILYHRTLCMRNPNWNAFIDGARKTSNEYLIMAAKIQVMKMKFIPSWKSFKGKSFETTIRAENGDDQTTFEKHIVSHSLEYLGLLRKIIDCFISDNDWLCLLGMLRMNVVGIQATDAGTCTGFGLYSVHSCLNHNCAPNVQVSLHEIGIQVHALNHISQGDELFIDYLCDSSDRRQQTLLEQYGFICSDQCICQTFDGISS